MLLKGGQLCVALFFECGGGSLMLLDGVITSDGWAQRVYPLNLPRWIMINMRSLFFTAIDKALYCLKMKIIIFVVVINCRMTFLSYETFNWLSCWGNSTNIVWWFRHFTHFRARRIYIYHNFLGVWWINFFYFVIKVLEVS